MRRRGLINRLQQNYQIDLIQSNAHYQNINDRSIIEQLNLDEQILQPQTFPLHQQNKLKFKAIESRVIEHSPNSRFNQARKNPLDSQINIQKMINSKVKSKFDRKQRRNQFPTKDTYQQFMHKYRYGHETPHRMVSADNKSFLIQNNKQSDQHDLKIKFDFKRSSVIRNKQFIFEQIIPQCSFCRKPMSQVYGQSLFCSNRRCRQKQIIQETQNYTVLGILFDMEIPSCTLRDIQQISHRINEELQKIEKMRKVLIQLSFNIQSLGLLKQKYDTRDRLDLKHFMDEVQLVKKTKVSTDIIADMRAKLISLNLQNHFDQFQIWQKLSSIQVKNFFKTIHEKIEKHKPLCLKSIKSSLINEQSILNNQFLNSTISLKVSEQIPFCFNQNIGKVFLKIDGSFQISRQCFLLVQEIQQLHLQFSNKRTSRQLRQLFHYLPKCRSLYFDFDYKVHSHVSSQGFPLLQKLFQHNCQQLSVNILNGRPQTLQDFKAAALILKPKLKIMIKIEMNQHLTHFQTRQNNINYQAIQSIITLLKNCSNKLVIIDLHIPLRSQKGQILQLIINNDYLNILQANFCFLAEQNEQKQMVQKMYEKILNKKKHILGLIVQSKRNPLSKLRDKHIKEAVFNMLI